MNKPLRIGITGTRGKITNDQEKRLRRVLSNICFSEFHHGDCAGVDAIGQGFVRELGFERLIVVHPPENKSMSINSSPNCFKVLESKPYLERNKDIVWAVDLLIVVPNTQKEVLKSGTWATYREAKKEGKMILLILP